METGPRRIYTGAIGFLSPGRIAQFNVAIRTLVADMDKRTAEYGLGSGIVWDSESRSEYDECLLKAQILFRNRPAFRLLETMRWSPDQGYTLLDSHLRRMEESADYFGFRFTRESIVEALSAYAHGLAPNAAKVRALLSRHGDLTCESEPLVQTDRPAPVRVCVAKSAVDISNPFLYHKTTYRAVYEEAKRDNPRADDVILWNNRGEVTESTVANVVVELDGELFTPPVSSGLLAGTYRAWLLDNRRVRERVIKTDELKKCSRLLLVNSVQGEREAVLEPHPEPVL
jgi:para-aminobenzoate synthetase/4-amino-4-deoxychorismate lyase